MGQGKIAGALYIFLHMEQFNYFILQQRLSGRQIHRPGKAVKFKAVFFIKPGITSEDLIGTFTCERHGAGIFYHGAKVQKGGVDISHGRQIVS